jgi:hypothetical protein
MREDVKGKSESNMIMNERMCQRESQATAKSLFFEKTRFLFF